MVTNFLIIRKQQVITNINNFCKYPVFSNKNDFCYLVSSLKTPEGMTPIFNHFYILDLKTCWQHWSRSRTNWKKNQYCTTTLLLNLPRLIVKIAWCRMLLMNVGGYKWFKRIWNVKHNVTCNGSNSPKRVKVVEFYGRVSHIFQFRWNQELHFHRKTF